jgi:hypothetical protein
MLMVLHPASSRDRNGRDHSVPAIFPRTSFQNSAKDTSTRLYVQKSQLKSLLSIHLGTQTDTSKSHEKSTHSTTTPNTPAKTCS